MTLTEKYPHLLSENPDGSLNLFVDHHMLSTFRLCEAKFAIEHMQNLRVKGLRAWSLEFGIWLHSAFERYYKLQQSGALASSQLEATVPLLTTWSQECMAEWDAKNMDWFASSEAGTYNNKKSYTLGGREGALALLLEYAVFNKDFNKTVIATEVGFGRGKEVPLGFVSVEHWGCPEVENYKGSFWNQVHCYLSGRADLVLQNGAKVGPLDFKTTAYFDGKEHEDFEVHEGITGYIYAIDKVRPELKCRNGWIEHISIASPKDGNKRFKQTLITKTEEQLEDYRQRNLRTCSKLLDVLNGSTPDWNTSVCTNIYHAKCPHHILHRSPTRDYVHIIANSYEKREAWNPETL